jgi:hypothetical protein
MEKIKIGSTEFDLVPMGISEDAQSKTRSFKVVKIMEFDDMRTAILEGVTQIDHIGNDGNISNSYMDCVSLKRLAAEYGTEIDVEPQNTYTIVLSTDASISEIRALQSQITALQEDNQFLQETVDALVLASLEPQTEQEGGETDV